MTRRLEGKVALVTGGSSGIGRAAALKMAEEGARVVVAARRVEPSQKVVRAIESVGSQALFVATDVTSADQVEALVERAVETFGRIDVAFNNAGIGIGGALHEASELDWDVMMEVNLKGVWLCMRAEIQVMLEQGGGTIINNASVAGAIPTPGVPIYGATKAAVISLTRSAAKGYGENNIRVNALCPGYTVSEMTSFLEEEDRRREILGETPLSRIADAEEMAEAVVWLGSEASSFMTGQAVVIDGGIGL